MTDNIKKIKAYIEEGKTQALALYLKANEEDFKIFSGKIAAYNDILDYIEYEIEGGINND